MTFLQNPSLVSQEFALKVLEKVYLSRAMDEKMSKLVRQNKGGSFFMPSQGHELIGVTAALSLIGGKDWALPYYRDRAFVIGWESSLVDILGAFLARDVAHHSGGRMMPDHFSHKSLRIPCQSSCVGAQFLQATGLALGVKLRKEKEVVYVSSGEGATSQGDFHEALNFSSLHKLPVLFVIQDNGWAISVPVIDQTAGGSIAKIGRGYEGLSVFEVSTENFVSLTLSLQQAVAKAREGKGPSLIVAKVPRLGAHSNSDDPMKYKDLKVIEEEKKRDPLPLLEKWIQAQGWLSEQELQERKDLAHQSIEEAAVEAERIPFPKRSSADHKVFIEGKEEIFHLQEKSSSSGPVVMMEAIRHALEEEMRKNPHVVVFGEDVAKGKGGVFGITRGLTTQFGEERCFNTPLAESTIVGIATGLSFDGFHRPVAEIQFADYAWTGMNQIVNELASLCYRSNGEWNCPVVLRMPYGGYIHGGPYHSQSIEAVLAHMPGLKIVVPSNASDAKRLLKAAIRDPNPVIFLEHKALYRQHVFCAREEPGEEELLPLGKAKVVREGNELTLLCWGFMVPMAVEVAEILKKEELFIEVIDLRTLIPLDKEMIFASLKKTGKVLIVHEAPKSCGFGAELIAQCMEEGFSFLDAPILRLCGKDCPVPYCTDLEEEVLPQKKDLEREVRKLIAF